MLKPPQSVPSKVQTLASSSMVHWGLQGGRTAGSRGPEVKLAWGRASWYYQAGAALLPLARPHSIRWLSRNCQSNLPCTPGLTS